MEAAYLVGYLVLARLEGTTHAPWALAGGVLTTALGSLLAWLLVLDRDGCEVDPWQAFRVSWFSITFFHMYDYAETQAAGIFRLPTRFLRPGSSRVFSTTVVLGILSLPLVQAVRHVAAAELRQLAELAIAPAGERVEAPSPDLERYLEQLPRAERDALLGRTKSRSPPDRVALYVEAAGAFSRLLILVVLGSLGPFVILVIITTCTGGRILLAYYQAFEAPDATEISYDE